MEQMQGERRQSIIVRSPRISFENVPRYWNGDPFSTHLLNALSSTFPDGEAFFVRSVANYRDQVEDPELLRAIRAFSGQEGQHSHLHAEHLEMLIDQGYTGLEKRNRFARFTMNLSLRKAPRISLASTAALEHLTAILARKIMNEPAFTEHMHPSMAALWRWHALEEAEHKAVAFDVFSQTVPGFGLRVWMLASNTVGMALEILERTFYMLWKDGLLFRRETWRQGWRFLLGERGLLRGLGFDYLIWYRRGFHPDDIDDKPSIDRALAETEAIAGIPAAPAHS